MGQALKVAVSPDAASLRRGGAIDFMRRVAEAGATELELRDVAEGAPVRTWAFPLEAESVFDEAVDAAETDAEGRAGLVRYALLARRDVAAPFARYVLKVDAGRPSLDHALDPAHVHGIELAESLRDRRELFRMTIMAMTAMSQDFRQMIDVQTMRAEAHEKTSLEVMALLRDLHDTKGERDMKTEKMRLDARTTRRALDEFMPLVGAAANRMLAKAGAPNSAMEPGLLFFLKSIDPDQGRRIAAVLTPTQQAVLFEIMHALEGGGAPLGPEMVAGFIRSIDDPQFPKILEILRLEQREFFLSIAGKVAVKEEARDADEEKARKGEA